jgi:hypothetical protein
LLAGLVEVAQSEVNELYDILATDEDVLGFNISVGDPERMQIFDGVEKLLKEDTCFGFFQTVST